MSLLSHESLRKSLRSLRLSCLQEGVPLGALNAIPWGQAQSTGLKGLRRGWRRRSRSPAVLFFSSLCSSPGPGHPCMCSWWVQGPTDRCSAHFPTPPNVPATPPGGPHPVHPWLPASQQTSKNALQQVDGESSIFRESPPAFSAGTGYTVCADMSPGGAGSPRLV